MQPSFDEKRQKAFEELRPGGFRNGECPSCSDLSIGFKMGADWAREELSKYFAKELKKLYKEVMEAKDVAFAEIRKAVSKLV